MVYRRDARALRSRRRAKEWAKYSTAIRNLGQVVAPEEHYPFIAKLFDVTVNQVAADVKRWKEYAHTRAGNKEFKYYPDTDHFERYGGK